MPRSIAEVNAIRRSRRSAETTGLPAQPSGHHGYDPNQPRVPAGHSDGGRWTSTGGSGSPPTPNREVVLDETGKEAWESVTSTYRPDGSLSEQEVSNRDGSRIVSQFSRDPRTDGWDERHTVVLPDGSEITFENSGDIQTVYDAAGRRISASVWSDDGPEAAPIAQPAFYQAPVAGAAVGGPVGLAAGVLAAAGLTLLVWLSTRNRRDSTAVLSIPASVYQPGLEPTSEPVRVGSLTQDELEEACKKYGNVQRFTDKAAVNAWHERKDWTPSGFGTEVHKRVARDVNGKVPGTNEFRSPNDPEDPNFMAEFSALKTKAADPDASPPRYGQKGTIRVDVLENRPDEKTVCVYDIKTGEKVLSTARIKEIVGAVAKHYGDALRIIITEIRPHL